VFLALKSPLSDHERGHENLVVKYQSTEPNTPLEQSRKRRDGGSDFIMGPSQDSDIAPSGLRLRTLHPLSESPLRPRFDEEQKETDEPIKKLFQKSVSEHQAAQSPKTFPFCPICSVELQREQSVVNQNDVFYVHPSFPNGPGIEIIPDSLVGGVYPSELVGEFTRFHIELAKHSQSQP